MKKFILYAFGLLGSLATFAQADTEKPLTLSSLFTNHMVLQQHSNVNFWGKCTPGNKVFITATWGKKATTIAGPDGKWKVKLSTPHAGGPYVITIESKGKIAAIKDVLIGEVWLASGQSNMDIPLKGWPPGDTIQNSAIEISKADYPKIRFLKVPFNISTIPLDSAGGKWIAATPASAGDFSAAAYFFALKLYNELHIPIGIVQSSIGGTPAEAWTSKDYLEKLGDFNESISRLKQLQEASSRWFSKWPVQAVPKSNDLWKSISFADAAAAAMNFDDTGWQAMNLPARIDRLPLGELDGAVWFRKEFFLTDTTADCQFHAGAIDDMDADYINGKYIGGLSGTGFATTPREVLIPKSFLVKGRNSIAIRIIDNGGQGFIHGPINISNAKGKKITLDGPWKFRWVAELLNGRFYTYGLNTNINERPEVSSLNSNSPTVLFNAMINPLIPYTFKGVIWYQGESNVGRAEQYKRLFPLMIADWRNKWGYVMPFYYVQLAPFIYSAADQKEQSQKLRDAQRYALKLPKTGMVATLDIGYLKTAHPPYKKEVGDRLAQFALSNDYRRNLVSSGPVFEKATSSGNKMIIKFTSMGSGLLSSPGGLNGFEVSATDKVWFPAQAVIVNNKVIVSNPIVSHPVFVRYAWSDSSTASLFNKEQLPAGTFTSEK